MKSNLAQEPPIPQGEVVRFPKKERQAMSKKEEGFTRTPNYLVDDGLVAEMTGSSLKCYLVICRFTEGFCRTNWAMTSGFLQEKTGVKKPKTLTDSVRQLEELGLVKVVRSTGETNKFSIIHPESKALPKIDAAILDTTPENGMGATPHNGVGTTPENGGTKKESIKENIKHTHIQDEPNKNSVDEILNLWRPDLDSLNSWLQRAGEMPMTQEAVEQVLLEVNPYYQQKILTGAVTDSLMYSNFVKWIKRKFVQKPKTPSQKQTQPATNSRNVNEKWGQEQQYAKATGEVDIGDFV
jgi:hypothetical protein